MHPHSLNNIRNSFVEFFKNKKHCQMPGSSLIPQNDPSLMFVNSGMVQFKGVFTGNDQIKENRVVTYQKSLRAGGKHNDLENVGYTSRHHTLFEMLGNFSFGDYFKEEAITYAWELLTKIYHINPVKLLVTVHHTDEEAAIIWKKVSGFDDSKIIRIRSDDNFWSMGETGPCGPCSEIFYDHGPELYGGLPGSPSQDGDRYVEIWNIVFMQYDQVTKTDRINLTKKSIDTGMGLERIGAVLQGVHDNYETDLFKQLIQDAQDIAKVSYNAFNASSYKVISDHIRAISFLIADNIYPSNEGRGYVLRRILRRAIRHAHQICPQRSILPLLANSLVRLMQDCYQELTTSESKIVSTIHDEEEKFRKTLDSGLKILNKVSATIKNGDTLPGKIAFELYDTYGFPLDLTQDILKNRNITVDLQNFTELMSLQKQNAKEKGQWNTKISPIWQELLQKFGTTKFFYDCSVHQEGEILAIVRNDTIETSIEKPETSFEILTDITLFYAEAGGQIGDIGIITSDQGQTILEITNTTKVLDKLHVHHAILKQGRVFQGQKICFEVNKHHRQNVALHHSATHILHCVLGKVLKSEITQKGSLVKHDMLRFDFNYSKAPSKEELLQIETEVNKIILMNASVTVQTLPSKQALEEGAIGLFEEKYSDMVRVVCMKNDTMCFSKELCGGTHVKSTGEIGSFHIVSEASIASGIRRIEAIAGLPAINYFRHSASLLDVISTTLHCSKQDISTNLSALTSKLKTLEQQNHQLQIQALTINDSEVALKGQKTRYGLVVCETFENIDVKILRESAIQNANNVKNGIFIFIGKNADKISVIACVNKNICNTLSATEIISKATSILDSKGGGNKLIAQTGADATNLSIKELGDLIIKELL